MAGRFPIVWGKFAFGTQLLFSHFKVERQNLRILCKVTKSDIL